MRYLRPRRELPEGAQPRIRFSVRLREAGAPLAVRAFRLHFTARLLSWTGSAVAPLGLAFAVLHIGGGANGLGMVLAASVVPQILLLLIGGVVADRWSRSRVMLWANLVSAAAQGLAALLLWSGSARVWHLVLTAAACGGASAFFGPAAGGVVVDVVPAPMRHAANALLKIGQNTVKVGGPALGGVLVATAGPAWAIGWDAITFALAAVLCSHIGLSDRRVKLRTGFVADLRDGWRDFSSRRWLWIMVVQGAVVVPVWLVGYQALGPVYGQEVLGGAAPWGVVVSGFTGGLIMGAALALLWRPHLVGPTLCLGTACMALPLATMALSQPLVLLVAAAVTAGTGLALSMTVWSSFVQERIPAERLGRTLSYATLGQLLPVPVGYLLAGPASAALGVRTTLAWGAALIGVAAVLPLAVGQVRGLSRQVSGTVPGTAPSARADR